MNDLEDEESAWFAAWGRIVDGAVSDAIADTPLLTEAQLLTIDRRRRQILRLALLPPIAFDEFLRSHKRAGWLVSVICALSAGAVWFWKSNRISLAKQVLLGYIAAIFVSWLMYYLTLIVGISLRRVAVFSIVTGLLLGLVGFLGTMAWWRSPYAPIKAAPEVSSAFHVLKSGGAPTSIGVQGMAMLSRKERLWVFISHKVADDDAWVPQGEAHINPATGKWAVDVGLRARGLGCEFRIAIVSVDAATESWLVGYTRGREENVSFSPTPIPSGLSIQQVMDILPAGGCNKPHQELLSLNFWPSEDPGYHALQQKEKNTATMKIESDPGNARAYYERALAHTELGEQTAAEEDASKSIELDQKNPQSFNVRGLARLRSGKPEQAALDFAIARSMEPDNKTFDANLATATNVSDDNANRVKYLEFVAQHRPFAGEIQFRLGLAYEVKSDREHAIQSFRKAVEYGPANVSDRAIVELRSLGVEE